VRQVQAFLSQVSHACAALQSDYELFDTARPLHPGLAAILARRSARVY
jgi:hypothetical protein